MISSEVVGGYELWRTNVQLQIFNTINMFLMTCVGVEGLNESPLTIQPTIAHKF